MPFRVAMDAIVVIREFRAWFDLIESDHALTVCFDAHLVRKPFHTFRDAL